MSNKVKYTLEFQMRCSSSLLFEYIATSSGLGEWFADDVLEKGDNFTFIWEGAQEEATLIKYKEESLVRFRWEEDDDTKYFWQLSIDIDKITDDIALIITDFAEEDEVEESKMYWEHKVSDLRKILGS